MKRMFIILTSMFVATALFYGCAPREEAIEKPEVTEEEVAEEVTEKEVKEKITVELWHIWEVPEEKLLKELFSGFTEQTGIEVKMLRVDDIPAKLAAAAPAGEAPDLISWAHDKIGTWSEMGIVVPIDELVSQELLDSYLESALSGLRYKGKLYGLPGNVESLTFVYNKDLLDSPPGTTDELYQLVTESEVVEYGFVHNFRNDPYFNAFWVHGYGGYYLDPDRDPMVGLSQPETIAAGEFIARFRDYLPKDVDYNVANALFTEGKAASTVNGPWAIAAYKEAGINFGLAPLPVISDTGEAAKPYLGIRSLLLTSQAKNKEAAFEVIKFYASKEVQSRLAQEVGRVPAVKGVEIIDPTVQAFFDQAKVTIPMPNIPEMDVTWGPVAEALESIWTGAKTPEQAFNDAQAQVEQSIEEMK